MPFVENETHRPNYTKPPPDLIDGEEEYEVKTILSHKQQGWGYLYLIKWIGYPDSENSWEPVALLTNTPNILNQYC